ncbi:MAG TPA: mechanosensitive ion channel family protein [Rhodothermales bacterium]|nr:mechanosensitive ion channel family protein [Rhodothermales bacterium]
MLLPQEVQQAVTDSLAAPQDTPIVDTTAAADTTSAITQLNREITEAGRLIATGEWELFVSRLYERLAELAANLIPKLSAALLAFLLFYITYRILYKVIRRLLSRSKRVDVGLEALLTKTYRVVAMTFILVMVLDQLGLNVAALLAGLSIAGIAVGFAARDTLENFISGISILMDRPFRIGDNVQIDGTFGTVEEITLRSTRLRTLNNEIMVMPNIQMINQKLVNHTMLNTLRVEIPFGIAYKEYPQEAREVVLKLTEGDERLHDDYKSQVVVLGLNDSSVDMALRLFLRNPKLEVPVRLEYIEKVREALREADIEIPFPHLQLFVDEAKAFENSFLMQPTLPPPKGKGGSSRPSA